MDLGQELTNATSGITDFLFGTSPSLTSTANLTPEQKALLDQLLAGLSSQYGTTPAYTGTLTAPQNALQTTSLAAMEQAALNLVNPAEATSTSVSALTDILGKTPEDLSSYFQTAVYDPAMAEFTNQILPAITQRFSGLSGFGSDRMAQEASAASQAATGIASEVAKTTQESQQNLLNAQLQAALGLPAAYTAGSATQAQYIADLLALQTGGAAAQATEQAGVTATYDEWKRQQDALQKQIEDLLAAIGVQTTTPVVTPGTPALGGMGINFGIPL